MTTYKITNMRVIPPSDKMIEKYPDRFVTVTGKFFNEKGEAMSITQKVITNEDANHPEFSIDTVKGILTLHSGERGRRPVQGMSQDEINARLKAIRNIK